MVGLRSVSHEPKELVSSLCEEGAYWSRSLAGTRRIVGWKAKFDTAFPAFLQGLQLDGYSPALNLAFEYHGEQHYQPDSYFNFGDLSKFQRQQERDSRKVQLCAQAGVRLVVVPFFVKDKHSFVRLALLQWFSVHPSLRIPRTFKRFAGLCVELLQRQKIRAAGANETLMKVVSNPVEKYLPPGCRRFGMSVGGRPAWADHTGVADSEMTLCLFLTPFLFTNSQVKMRDFAAELDAAGQLP
ncbi:mra1 [Symbiodinium natans]|uniref:Mra1 protein n=1 Tax=Symbiodinium natans TaxID=878477 RepID=A0A812I623_9DINO|nr:mra1 [Symbiodinium natans]